MEPETAQINKLQDIAEEANASDIPAQQFMTNKVFTVDETTSIKATIDMLKNHRISGAPVVDDKYHLHGVISEFDLLMQAATKDLNDRIDFTKTVITVNPETPIKDIIVILYKTKFKRLPVVDEHGMLLGIVCRIDVLNKLLQTSRSS